MSRFWDKKPWVRIAILIVIPVLIYLFFTGLPPTIKQVFQVPKSVGREIKQVGSWCRHLSPVMHDERRQVECNVLVCHSEMKILRMTSSNPSPSKRRNSFCKCLLVHPSISAIRRSHVHDGFQKGARNVHFIEDRVDRVHQVQTELPWPWSPLSPHIHELPVSSHCRHSH